MKFEKVSLNQFVKDVQGCAPGLSKDGYEFMYNELKLPKRATTGSAGYDFFAPFSFQLKAGESIKIPTGIRGQLDIDKFPCNLSPQRSRLQVQTPAVERSCHN